jgi:hypothetical protein
LRKGPLAGAATPRERERQIAPKKARHFSLKITNRAKKIRPAGKPPYKVEAWLKELKSSKGRAYSKKTREPLKAMLYMLHDAATFFEYLSDEHRNPMDWFAC